MDQSICCKGIPTGEYFMLAKNDAIICDIGHFDCKALAPGQAPPGPEEHLCAPQPHHLRPVIQQYVRAGAYGALKGVMSRADTKGVASLQPALHTWLLHTTTSALCRLSGLKGSIVGTTNLAFYRALLAWLARDSSCSQLQITALKEIATILLMSPSTSPWASTAPPASRTTAPTSSTS